MRLGQDWYNAVNNQNYRAMMEYDIHHLSSVICYHYNYKLVKGKFNYFIDTGMQINIELTTEKLLRNFLQFQKPVGKLYSVI